MKLATFLITFLCSVGVLAQRGRNTHAEIAIPGVRGILQIDVGATDFQTRVRSDGKEIQLQALGRPDHLDITAFLQKVAFPASAERCRAEWWPGTKKSAPIRRDNLDESIVKDGIARVEYMVPELDGVKIHQKNIHAYLGSGNLCAEIHLAKTAFEMSDENLFELVLSSVELLPDELPSGDQRSTIAEQAADDGLLYPGKPSI